MKISKRMLFILVPVLVLVLTGAVAFAAVGGPFPDVPATHWAYSNIMKLAGQGVIVGYQDGTFGPEDNITRAQAAAMMDRLEGVVAGNTAESSCTDCHNSGTSVTGKEAQYGLSVHGAGVEGESAFELALGEGTNKSCTACHSGNGFSAAVDAGVAPDAVTAGQTDPTRVDCRACHAIHETGTDADWALETEAPVALIALDATFDGGAGNLCANCHQPRRAFPGETTQDLYDETDVVGYYVSSTHWGPHHGPQSSMLLGIGGASDTGSPHSHYTMPADTCVTCHMGSDDSHTFEPDVPANCVSCHANAEDKMDDLQDEIATKLETLEGLLIDAGLLADGTTDYPLDKDGVIVVDSELLAEGTVIVGVYTKAEASALWDYILVGTDDKSMGVHNPDYANDLLDAAIASFTS